MDGGLAADARLWWQKWRWYERNTLPWNRARIHWELMRRRAFARWPIHGNVLEALREGRLEVGEHTLFEPNVWITAPAPARVLRTVEYGGDEPDLQAAAAPEARPG